MGAVSSSAMGRHLRTWHFPRHHSSTAEFHLEPDMWVKFPVPEPSQALCQRESHKTPHKLIYPVPSSWRLLAQGRDGNEGLGQPGQPGSHIHILDLHSGSRLKLSRCESFSGHLRDCCATDRLQIIRQKCK